MSFKQDSTKLGRATKMAMEKEYIRFCVCFFYCWWLSFAWGVIGHTALWVGFWIMQHFAHVAPLPLGAPQLLALVEWGEWEEVVFACRWVDFGKSFAHDSQYFWQSPQPQPFAPGGNHRSCIWMLPYARPHEPWTEPLNWKIFTAFNILR